MVPWTPHLGKVAKNGYQPSSLNTNKFCGTNISMPKKNVRTEFDI